MSVPANATLTLTPFTPSFTDKELQGLKQKLKQCRKDLPAVTYASKQRKYGIEHSSIVELLAYWENDFDWCVMTLTSRATADLAASGASERLTSTRWTITLPTSMTRGIYSRSIS